MFSGTDLTVTAKRTSAGGDGLVNVGYLDATGANGGDSLDLGNVVISGDLGAIVAGDGVAGTAAVKSLSVGSMGRYGEDTQAGAGATLSSFFTGALGRLTVRGDVAGSSLVIDGTLGALTIGGSLLGGDLGGAGFISASGDLGPVKIGGDLAGNNMANSGHIEAAGSWSA